MSQDISLIRKELENHIEIKLPCDFPKKCHIKYITHNLKKNTELFYKGGEFLSFGNNCIRVKNKARSWNIPIYLYHKDGSIKYTSHFYILDDNKECEQICDEKNKELNETIQFQQSTIQKLTDELCKLELQKSYIIQEKKDYEELLQQNRHNLKDLSIVNREKDQKIKNYEELIKRLTNSHPLFNKND